LVALNLRPHLEADRLGEATYFVAVPMQDYVFVIVFPQTSLTFALSL